MRSATTSLFYQIKNHPDIYVPEIKETDFFCYHFNDGFSYWYNDLFRDKTESIVGEISPNYTSFKTNVDTPKNIYSKYPNIKLIYIMRDPIERIISEYKFYIHKK
jgi:hypothetical protein